jgi:putative transposase
MSRFRKQSHTIWYCEYHIVWCPKYRYRVLAGKIKEEAELCIRELNRQMQCEVVELNVQVDHVHLVAMIPPKVRLATPSLWQQPLTLLLAQITVQRLYPAPRL